MKDLMGLMKQAQAMQEKMQAVQAELEEVLEGRQAMGPGAHDGPGTPAVDDVAHGPSIVGARSVGKPGASRRETRTSWAYRARGRYPPRGTQ